MAQLSTALSVLSGLSLAGLGFLFSLLREASFKPTGCVAIVYLLAVAAFFVASVAGVAAVITRLLDFRLTASKVRGSDSEEPLTMFGTTASGYGKATWRLFWVLVAFLLVGVVSAAGSISVVYLGGVLRAAGF
jgi:hypothetical protein